MPTDYPRPPMQSFTGDKLIFAADAQLQEKLHSLAAEQGTTLYMVILAAFNVLLAKYTGQEDVIVGSPVNGRPHADLEKIIGMFINTLALRNYPRGYMKFSEFLAAVKTNSIKAFENQDYQFEDLVDSLDVPRDLSRNPLFDVMFILQDNDGSVMNIDDLSFNLLSIEQ